MLKIDPKETIMVGDSCNDIEAGFSAGTFIVTVPYGYQYGQSITSNKVDLAIKNLNDLVEIIN
jgi:phosphoglycolate phosphatase